MSSKPYLAQASETLPIVYQDDDLVVVHKPSGLLVHRSMIDRHETHFAVQMVRNQIGQHVFPIHRLDKGTSGVLVFALHSAAARHLGEQVMAQSIGKRYVALVRGHPAEKGWIDHPLSRQDDDYAQADVPATRAAPVAQSHLAAQTAYRRLACCEIPIAVEKYPSSRYALLELTPHTGRRHQIRRHLKHISHPIIGDANYGRGRHNRMFAEYFGSQRLLLACTGMTITHPRSGEPLALHAPLADDFIAVLRQLPWAVDVEIVVDAETRRDPATGLPAPLFGEQ